MKKLGICLIIFGLLGICICALMNNQSNSVAVPVKQHEAESSSVVKASGNHDSNILNVSDINESMIKKGDITVVGYVEIKRYTTNNHLSFVLKDLYNDSQIDVILFSKTIRKFPQFEKNIKRCNMTKTPVFIYGPVSRYKGSLEIKAFEVYTR